VGSCARAKGNEHIEVSIDTTRGVHSVRAENPTDDKMANTHSNGTVNEERSTSRVIDEKEGTD
jgi:hypothetical protein